MSDQPKDGGPAFPCDVEHEVRRHEQGFAVVDTLRRPVPGMSLRDYFAAHLQADDQLVKTIRAMDDSALELFALHPDCEREEHITEVDLTVWSALPSEVAKVRRRLELEAAAIARVRFMQADAMLKAREPQR